MHQLKTLSLIILICISVIGCTSISDNVVQAIDEESFNELEDIYALVLEYRFIGDTDSLLNAQNQLDALVAEPAYNKDYRTRLLGLAALASYYDNNKGKAQSLIEQNPGTNDEFKWIAQGLLKSTPEERLEILLSAKESVLNPRHLHTYMAETYIELAEYGKAVALFDEFLLEAKDTEKAYYNETREMAFEFMKNAPANVENLNILSKSAINFEDLLTLTHEDSSFLDNIIENEAIESEELMQQVKEVRLIYKADTEIKQLVLRKELAYFLFKLIAHLTEDDQMVEDLEALYIEDISEQQKEELKGSSPIPDVEIYDYYFYAAIYLVETEIMELPDGENFNPDGTVSGFEYNEIITKIKSWF